MTFTQVKAAQQGRMKHHLHAKPHNNQDPTFAPLSPLKLLWHCWVMQPPAVLDIGDTRWTQHTTLLLWLQVWQSHLQDAVHEAGVAQVVEATQTQWEPIRGHTRLPAACSGCCQCRHLLLISICCTHCCLYSCLAACVAAAVAAWLRGWGWDQALAL